MRYKALSDQFPRKTHRFFLHIQNHRLMVRETSKQRFRMVITDGKTTRQGRNNEIQERQSRGRLTKRKKGKEKSRLFLVKTHIQKRKPNETKKRHFNSPKKHYHIYEILNNKRRPKSFQITSSSESVITCLISHKQMYWPTRNDAKRQREVR